MLGIIHTGCAVLALLLGAGILLATKGTRTHVRAGWAYVVSMGCVNGTAFALYNLTGRFNTFHALAILSLATVTIGVVQVRRRGPKWMWRHYQYMAWSYVGLLAATCNEAFVRVPALQRLAASSSVSLPLLAMLLVVAVSGMLIFASQKRVMSRYAGYNRPVASDPDSP